MARRHWLDPLARRLLIATGQLADASPAQPWPRRLIRTRPISGGDLPAEGCDDLAAASGHHAEQVERELLELKLRGNPGLRLRNAEEVRHAAALGWCLDVNRAAAADWLRLPGCGLNQADRLLRSQAEGQQLTGAEDLRRLLDLTEAEISSWLPVLVFHCFNDAPRPKGPPPLRINQASDQLLRRQLNVSDACCRLLLRERAIRPFRNLEDLRQRLRLPVPQVEAWIGRLSFEPGLASPLLPPAPHQPGEG
jgi:DNA uptake protein ComE-like DNA-binding protein